MYTVLVFQRYVKNAGAVFTLKFHPRLPTLWSRSYYAGSCGAVTEASVRRYIEGQKGK